MQARRQAAFVRRGAEVETQLDWGGFLAGALLNYVWFWVAPKMWHET